MDKQIILASASPRRRELLDQIGVHYEVKPVEIDETPHQNEAPLAYVQRIANEKALSCVNAMTDSLPVLAADTTVVLGDRIMGKPENFEHARDMLRTLADNTHTVFSAVTLRQGQNHQLVSRTEVSFRSINEQEIADYWRTGEPCDKAGAYAIQGYGAVFIEQIKGSYSGVMGLPIYETARLLEQQGIKILR